MKNLRPLHRWPVGLAALLFAAAGLSLRAFPPAPDSIIFGEIRDQFGNPLLNRAAQVYMVTSAGTNLVATITPGISPGVNYQIRVPMDSGLTSELYAPTAMVPAVPFKIRVVIGNTAYLPMEMKSNYAQVGKPGARTRLDLTLGVDTDGDGLPDAWEMAVIQMLGNKLTLADITPGGMFPGTGLTYQQVYIAGTYAYAPANGFVLKIAGMRGTASVLQFTAVKGRTYTVQASTDMNSWQTVPFSIPAFGANNGAYQSFQATNTMAVEIETPGAVAGQPYQFYNLSVQ